MPRVEQGPRGPEGLLGDQAGVRLCVCMHLDTCHAGTNTGKQLGI